MHRKSTGSTHGGLARVGRITALVLLAASVSSGAIIPAGADDSAEGTFSDELKIGGAVFGKAEYVLASRGGLPAAFAYHEASPEAQAAEDPCVTKSMYCRLYTVNVAESGGTLRIAMESSKRGECFALEVRDPDGNRQPHPGFSFVCPEVAKVFLNAQSYNIEKFIPNAKPGEWKIRVLGMEVEDWAYRVRAALEGAPSPEPELLTPNLTPWLPSEFGFVAPANPEAGTAPDYLNPPGVPGVSCHPDDGHSGPDAVKPTKCLRFSTGVYNNGDGPLYLQFGTDNSATQRVFYSRGTPGQYDKDSTYLEREAGTAEFHAAHQHRHFQDMVRYQLFEVSDSLPTHPSPSKKIVIEVGEGIKHGYCTFSQRIERWSQLNQDPQYASFPLFAFGASPCDEAMTLERGWGDLYRWQRPDQYVPYDGVADADGTMRAGFYVVRVTVDPEDRLLETKESDNTGYAYIRVFDGLVPNSDTVTVCELGYGDSPWDANKKVVPDAFSWATQLTTPAVQPGAC